MIVSNDRCLQCGKEGNEYHRLYECEVHKILRFGESASTSSKCFQAQVRMVWARLRGETNGAKNKLCMGKTRTVANDGSFKEAPGKYATIGHGVVQLCVDHEGEAMHREKWYMPVKLD